jgi:hypothetical protein
VGRASASALVPGGVGDAEALWYDVGRWSAFVDGFASVVRRDEAWPERGELVWDSTPAGRGRVVERVIAYAAGAGQTAEVEDERLFGTQQVAFEAAGDRTRVTLVLDYSLKERNLFTPLVDLLFVRRAVGDALRRTLVRFAVERRGDAELT